MGSIILIAWPLPPLAQAADAVLRAGDTEPSMPLPRPSRHARAEAQRLGDGIAALITATIKPPAVGVDRGALLAAVTQPREERARRPTVSTRAAVAVFRRDSWTCRYCGVKTIAPPVLRFLSDIYPKEFPYHPNWKSGEIHDSWLMLSTSLDHVVPGARGGDWTATENLVAACWACNSAKADLLLEEVGWDLLGEDDVSSDWDGLTGAVDELWRLAGSPEGLSRPGVWRWPAEQADSGTQGRLAGRAAAHAR